MKVTVDKEKCIGCGLCADICAAVFSLDETGKAEATQDDVPADSEARCREAVEQCPVEAIAFVK